MRTDKIPGRTAFTDPAQPVSTDDLPISPTGDGPVTTASCRLVNDDGKEQFITQDEWDKNSGQYTAEGWRRDEEVPS